MKKSEKTAFEFRGSLTVEAALLFIPLLLFLIGLLVMMEIPAFTLRLQLELEERARMAAVGSNFLRMEEGFIEVPEEAEWAADLIVNVGATVFLQNEMKGIFEEKSYRMFLKSDFSAIHSRIMEDDVDFSIVYTVSLFPSSGFIPGQKRIVRNVRHVWNGESLSLNEDEVLVYVTENRSVYHMAPDCTYLKAGISYHSRSELLTLRNASGEKYEKCKRCNPSEEDRGFYVSKYGILYHGKSTCTAIFHNAEAVPLSEVQDLIPPCSKCGR